MKKKSISFSCHIRQIEIINGTGQLLPGMFGKATITMQEKNALVIPANTIRFDQHGDEMIVYVVQNGTVKHVPVTLGLDDGHQIEVLSGLTEQDQIVAGMLGRLKDGASVELIKWVHGLPTTLPLKACF